MGILDTTASAMVSVVGVKAVSSMASRHLKSPKGRSKYPRRSRRSITYHARSGKPIIHQADNGRLYIMVRAPGGRGTKRLYSGSKYQENGRVRTLNLKGL